MVMVYLLLTGCSPQKDPPTVAASKAALAEIRMACPDGSLLLGASANCPQAVR